jgi:hypothetical protein
MKINARYRYTGVLLQPLRPGESADDKISLLYKDLGAASDTEAALVLAVRHISGFQRTGPKSRVYPSGPLRWHLKPNEKPDDKLSLLYAYLGVATPKEAVLALAYRHVPGFRPLNKDRAGGRTRAMVKAGLSDADADVDEQFLCDIIDMLREENPGKKLFAIAYELSIYEPPPGSENPGYGKDPKWIYQRYTNRKRYDKASDNRFARTCRAMRTILESER